MHQFTIDGSPLNADVIYKASSKQHSLYLSDTVSQKVAKNRAYLDNKMQDPNAVIYGINTGFGSCAMSEYRMKTWGNFKKILSYHMLAVWEKECPKISAD